VTPYLIILLITQTDAQHRRALYLSGADVVKHRTMKNLIVQSLSEVQQHLSGQPLRSLLLIGLFAVSSCTQDYLYEEPEAAIILPVTLDSSGGDDGYTIIEDPTVQGVVVDTIPF